MRDEAFWENSYHLPSFSCIQKKPNLRCFSGLRILGSTDVTTQKYAILYSFSEKYLKTARWSFVGKSFFDQAVAIFWFTSVNKCSCGYIIQLLEAKEIILTQNCQKKEERVNYTQHCLTSPLVCGDLIYKETRFCLERIAQISEKKFWKWFYRSPSIILNLKSDSYLPK